MVEEPEILSGEIDDDTAAAILVRPEPVIFTGSLAVQARKTGQLKNTFVDDPRIGREYAQREHERRNYIPADKRPPKKQISVSCSVCGRNQKIYPSELSVSIGEQGESPLFVCNRCSRRR